LHNKSCVATGISRLFVSLHSDSALVRCSAAPPL
jgi:hypothetical protein